MGGGWAVLMQWYVRAAWRPGVRAGLARSGLAATTSCSLCQGPRGESASGVHTRQIETWVGVPSPSPASLRHAPGNDWC